MVFLEFPCFFYDLMYVGNLISGSSAFSKSSLYIWNFSVQILLKSSLKDLGHNLDSMWNECNCVIVWTFFDIVHLWDWNKTDLFQSCGHCWVFQIFCWHTECSTFTTSSFRIWNSSVGIPSPPLALFLVLLHSVFQGQICLLLQVFLDFLLLHSSPLEWKGHLLGC